MAVVDRQQYIDRLGISHAPPECNIQVKEVTLNSDKTDPATGDPIPVLATQPVCVTHGDRPVSPKN